MINYKHLALIGVVLTLIGFPHAARTAGIEKLVMPGPVISAHADIESECSECHAAFSKTLQSDLCLGCHAHKNVLEDQQAGTGIHGRFAPAKNAECASCHTEHEGRDAKVVHLDMESFDHNFTDFALEGAHIEVVCEDCHKNGVHYRDTPSACFDCHQNDESHHGSLGENCNNCHVFANWETTSFDHARDTGHTLTGAHQEVVCAVCHTNQRYQGIPSDCYSCHQIDDYHEGSYGQECDKCHQTEEWNQTNFDHARVSGFALQGRHAEIDCSSCHRANVFDIALDQQCSSCHLVDDVHQGTNGTECGDCHQQSKWSKSGFDHQAKSNFALRGAHSDLVCKACHGGSRSAKDLDSACISCHQFDDVHEATLGENCASCHQETAWSENIRFDHDLSSFPLIGLHAIAPCEACHVSRRFDDAPGQCVDCHEQDDGHQGSLGTECGSCHNPNDWQLWEFDHTLATDFGLEGSHADLACESCHVKEGEYLAQPATTCFACHRSDDIHSGQFGRQCARCHDSGSFGVTGTLQ